jgi:heat shock protein HslJ
VIRRRFIGALMVIGLLGALPTMAVAQDNSSGPEGWDWALTSYLSDDSARIVGVPVGVAASLLLEDGDASGSGGCNGFDGNYRLNDDTILFNDELIRTLALCDDAIQSVEDNYLSNLPLVATWAISNGVLEFYDDFDDLILTFEVPSVVLTTGQLAALMTTLSDLQDSVDAINERIDNANVPKIRDRLNKLESDTARLKQQIGSGPSATPRPTTRPTTPPPATGFNRAEQVLLSGIPQRIANRCEPWRDFLPSGAVAAVRCKPNTTTTSDLAYYLMDHKSAIRAFDDEMSNRGVPETSGPSDVCSNDVESWTSVAPGTTVGCDRRPGPLVYVGIVKPVPGCSSVEAGGRRVSDPAYWIQLEGSHNSIKRTYDWATKGSNGIPTIAGAMPSC